MVEALRRPLKQKLRSRGNVFASWTSFGHAGITEILARAKFDFIGIDMEHSTISQQEAKQIIAAAQSGGVACLPRIASHNLEMARRLLDSGADGLIVPMIESAEDVQKVVDWMKYPPVGKRGFGVGRAQGYGFDFEPYTKTWNDSSIFIAQIESIHAVNQIDGILANGHLDGIMVGPYDISGSLKVPGQIDHPQVVEAGLKVVAACKKKGIACGTQIVDPDEGRIKQALEQGYSFVVLASDVFLLWKWSARMGQLMQPWRS